MKRNLLAKLIRLHIITPRGICRLARCLARDGISLMAVLRFAAMYYPGSDAIVEAGERLNYKAACDAALRMALTLHMEHGLKPGMSVGLMCRNHLTLALLLPALSRLGVNVKLLNTDLAPDVVSRMVSKLDLFVYDRELSDRLSLDDFPCAALASEDVRPGAEHDVRRLPRVRRGGNISVFTGGSSGNYTEASRRMMIAQFLPPFFALLRQIHIDEHDSVLLMLPAYHGFGLATLVISLVMGKKVCLMRRFDTAEALRIIAAEHVEVLPAVPAMLARMWQSGDAARLLRSLKCVICGGDRLDRKWIDVTHEHLGGVIYNLYGTSEAGFFMLATPEDLEKNDEVTIGKPIPGVACKIENPDSHGVGALWVRSGWAMMGMKDRWQNTGDLVSRNAQGYYFYRGRSDNMVVCGGENVYPENVERIINSHPDVLISGVFAAHDEQFGTVLHADVERSPESHLTADDLKSWLRPRLSRAEMPHRISLNTVGISSTGKITRLKALAPKSFDP